eukprot:143256-Pyramimonas_sp.AAC.1
MRNKEEAQLFRDEMEQALEAKLTTDGYTEAASWMRSQTLESAWMEMVSTLQSCAQRRYATSRKDRPEWYVRKVREREAGLRARTAARDHLDGELESVRYLRQRTRRCKEAR